MAKAKRDRRTSIRNMGAGDDALAALERLEQLEQQHDAARPKEPNGEADETADESPRGGNADA